MSTDAPAARSASSPGPTSRRRALGILGAGGAAFLASLFARNEARAGHDGTNTFHLGQVNSSPGGASTTLNATASPTLALGNSSGAALAVAGQAVFSTAGAGSIPAGDQSVFVSNPSVTADSHISVTLVDEPGRREVRWVERAPGSGFTVHLSSAPPPHRPGTALTYLIVEPAP